MAAEPSFADLLAAHAAGAGLERLVRFAELLDRWSARHNLVRYATREELVRRHILDSLAAAPQLGPAGRLLDVGSGAGLPGVPLLVVRPGWSGVLIEPRQKRWAFLRAAVREAGVAAEVLRIRYQELGEVAPFDVITIRAVGQTLPFLDWAKGRLTPDGAVLVWTTLDGEDALKAAADWRVVSSQLPGLDCGRLARLQPCFT